MNDEYDFDFMDSFNKGNDAPASPSDGGGRRPLIRDLPKSDKNSLRSMVSVPVGGGTLTPAKIGNTYGARWTAQFSKGGKAKSASSRGDGIAQRGKTRGRYL
jgi:hypothetical protein